MSAPTRDTPVLAVVVPCYNEEPVIEETAKRLLEVLSGLKATSKISDGSLLCFVDDGSEDGTWERVVALHSGHPGIVGLKLARNVGHQNALLAGILSARSRAGCAVSIDADLQDDFNDFDEVYACPFDRDAVLFAPRELRALAAGTGLKVCSLRYPLFFPTFLRRLRFLEKSMGLLSLGGQYCIHATS